MKPLVLWGASGQAKVLRELTTHLGYQVVAVFDNDPDVSPPFTDVPLFTGRAGFDRWRAGTNALAAAGLVAIGGGRGQERLALQQFLRAQGIAPLTVSHPTAFVAGDAELGAGCQVLAQAAVCAGARLGDATIVNTGASVDHECVLGRGVHVAPGARLAGCVRVAEYSLISIGAVVLPRVTIGAGCLIGAGAVVTRNVPDHAVVVGNPGKIIKYLEPGAPNETGASRRPRSIDR